MISAILVFCGREFATYSMAILALFHPKWRFTCAIVAPLFTASVAAVRLQQWPVYNSGCCSPNQSATSLPQFAKVLTPIGPSQKVDTHFFPLLVAFRFPV
jgi:hypothetical protein